MTKGDKRFLATLMMMLLWILVHMTSSNKDLSYNLYILMIVCIGLYFFGKDLIKQLYKQLYDARKKDKDKIIVHYVHKNTGDDEVIDAELI